MIEPIDNHEEQQVGLLIEQYQEKPRIAAWVASLARQTQEAEDMLWQVVRRYVIDENTPSDLLEKLGAIVVEPRDDRPLDVYRLHILAKIRINWSQGNPNDIIAVLRIVEPTAFKYIEHYPMAEEAEYVAPPVAAPQVLADIMAKARMSGTSTAVVAAEFADDLCFMFTLDDESESATQGFADDAETVGGVLANVYQ